MGSSPSELSACSAARALSDLTQSAGYVDRANELERTFDALLLDPQTASKPALERVAGAAHSAGLRVRQLNGTLSEALGLVASGTPILIQAPGATETPAGAVGEPAESAVSNESPTEPGLMVVCRPQDGRFVVRTHFEAPVGTKGVNVQPEERLMTAAELEDFFGEPAVQALAWMVLEDRDIAELRGSAAEAAHAAGPPEPPGPIARLVKLFEPDRGDLLAVLVFAVAVGVLLLATPIAVQAVVNSVALGGALQPLVVVAFLLFLGLAFAAVLRGLQAWIIEVLQRRVFGRLVAQIAARLPRVSYEVYDRHHGPELVNRFFDIVTIQKSAAGLLAHGLTILLSVLVGLTVLAFYHPVLLALDVLLLLLIALIVFAPLRRGMKTAVGESYAKYEVADWLEELARHPVLFRSAGTQPWILESTDRVVGNYLDRRAAHYRVVLTQIVSALGLQVFASTALLGVGGYLVIQNSLTLGQLVAAELIVTTIVASVASIGKHLESFYDLTAAMDKVGLLLDLPIEDSSGEIYLAEPDGPGAELELRKVTRKLPKMAPLFEGVSVHVQPGCSLAIRGTSGVGKSALLELLWGMRRPDGGMILLDGHSLGDLSIDSLRSSASLVAGSEILASSVRENVRVGRPAISDRAVRSALRRVGLLEDLESMTDGLDTQVNARGWPLSVGQQASLQLARAIAGQPRLLIVTDDFGNLSPERRELLLDTLFDQQSGWTLLIATNAEDALERCDQVLELPSGSVTGRSSLTADA